MKRGGLLAPDACPIVTAPLREFDAMLAEPEDAPFSAEGWWFELKYDGYRTLAAVDGQGEVHLYSRRKLDAARDHPRLAAALRALGHAPLLLDAERVVFEPDGHTSFQRLQRGEPASLVAFDLLVVDGRDVRGLPLSRRKALLRTLLEEHPSPDLGFADHVEDDGLALFAQVQKLGLEGVMAKRADAPYRAGRSEDWKKICVARTLDLVVVGYQRPEPPRLGVSSLHLAGYRGEELVYAGKVGAAFPEAMLARLGPALDSRRVEQPPCRFVPERPQPRTGLEVWCAPELVCEVRYKGITDGGFLRQPIAERLRADKPLRECLLPLLDG